MSISKPTFAAIAVLLTVVAGCGGNGAPQANPGAAQRNIQDGTQHEGHDTQQDTGGAAGETPADASAAGRPIAVRVIDENEFAEVLSGYRGQVVLVDFWATWCLACIQHFPHTVALYQRFADEGLAVISVSFDQPDSKPAVLDFLKKQGAAFDNFISRYGAGVESAERFDLPGSLPQLLLFDRQGELAHTFPEPQAGVDPEQVEQAVKELLKPGPQSAEHER